MWSFRDRLVNLRDLEYLIALSEQGHFGRAAAKCSVSQPTLSAQLRKLEDSLGVELIERGTRPILLTATGREVLAHAKSIQQEIAQIEVAARLGSNPSIGQIRLGVFPTLGPYLLPHVIPSVSETFPDLRLLLVELRTREIVAELREGTLDVGILALPLNQDGLHIEPLFEEDFVLAVSADDPIAEQDGPVPLSILQGQPLLLLEDGHCLRDQALSLCQTAGAVEDDLRATSLETLRQMVSAGLGMTLLPRLSASPPVPENPRIKILEFQSPAPSREIGMIWRNGSAIRQFLPKLADLFQKAGPMSAHSDLAS